MRKSATKSADYERLKRNLNAENAPSEDFIAVLRSDLDALLKSYFVYSDGDLIIDVRLADCGTELEVKCRARSRKPIKVL